MTTSSIRSLERKIVAHCSPVLAGLKPASMFSCHLKCRRCYAEGGCSTMGALDFALAFSDCQRRLRACGVELAVLAQRDKSMLVFLYRPDLLAATLADERVSDYLAAAGYPVHASVDSCLGVLSSRIALFDTMAGKGRACAFPHEVGLFLGYPFDDVMGFIENAGCGFVASGCWKAYSRKRDALDAFCKLDACKQELCGRFENGARLEELALQDGGRLRPAA